MQVAVIVFPGSNSDWDSLHTARDVMGWQARYVFHKETELGPVDAVLVPGGFAHGDYLRCGAIARFSPIAGAIQRFAERGGPILGICNGFQILTEMGLLPGALTRNSGLTFLCRDVWVRSETTGAFTQDLAGKILRLPIAHAEGRYHCDDATLATLRNDARIAFRYVEADGSPLGSTWNGSRDDIAGVYNESKTVLGMMPHPERAAELILGNDDGSALFHSLGAFVKQGGLFLDHSPTQAL